MYIFHIFTHIFTYSSCPEACIDSIVIILCPDIDAEAVFGGGGSVAMIALESRLWVRFQLWSFSAGFPQVLWFFYHATKACTFCSMATLTCTSVTPNLVIVQVNSQGIDPSPILNGG